MFVSYSQYRQNKLELVWEEHRSRAMIVQLRRKATKAAEQQDSSTESKKADQDSHTQPPPPPTPPPPGDIAQAQAWSCSAGPIFIANVHLEGHPTCADDRFNQLK